MLSERKVIIPIVLFAALATILLLVVSAANDNISFEAESSASSLARSDSSASNGSFIEFGGGSTGLPDPINPSSNRFSEILDDFGSGGLIVIPNGTYTASDLSNFNPSSRLTVVAESRNGVIVERYGQNFGQTDFSIFDSSDITFVGVHFKDITTYVRDSNDIEFLYTRHTYPIEASPDPTRTYCGALRDPTAVQIDFSDNIDFTGADIVGFGHDGLKLSRSDNIDVIGTVLTEGDHGGLQNGNGNETCGWDGDDNYHNDGVQIFPGGVDNLRIESSYIGRRLTLQVDNNGTSINNLRIINNWFYVEPPVNTNCISADMRVKSGAQSGATMTVTMTDNQAWCRLSDWSFYVGGSRNNDLVINGTPISSSDRNASNFWENIVGTPDIEDSPAYDWRAQNTYQSFLNGLN